MRAGWTRRTWGVVKRTKKTECRGYVRSLPCGQGGDRQSEPPFLGTLALLLGTLDQPCVVQALKNRHSRRKKEAGDGEEKQEGRKQGRIKEEQSGKLLSRARA